MISNRGEIIKEIESRYLKKGEPYDFAIGDAVKVHFKITEGKRQRLQVFEGIIIAINGAGIRKNITVRKISFNVGVERVFPIHSPKIDKISVVRKGRVRRSKLYYLRNRKGKAAQVKRLIENKKVQVVKKVEPKVNEPTKVNEAIGTKEAQSVDKSSEVTKKNSEVGAKGTDNSKIDNSKTDNSKDEAASPEK